MLYLEHKLLYRSAKGDVPAGYYTVPIGEARVARAGRDATIVTYGVGGALGARRGGRARSQSGGPRDRGDRPALAAAVGRDDACSSRCSRPAARWCCTRRRSTGGFGGEVAATIGREAFDWLDAPVARLGALDTPVPFSKALEEIFSPKAKLLPALRDLLAY